MPSIHLASRAQALESSATLDMAARAKALANEGKGVVDFSAGEPDFDTPEPIKQAGIEAIRQGFTKYTTASGIPELRKAIAETLRARYGLPYEPSQIVVTCGAKQAVYNVLQVLCEPGDEVLIPAPYWVSYPPMVRLAGATPVIMPTQESDDFKVRPDALQRALSPKTRLLVLNSPSNPTGTVYDRAELEALAKMLEPTQALVLSDEIYDQLVYPPHRHVSWPMLAPEWRERTVLVNGVSKTYAMTGWRIGYAAGPAVVLNAVAQLQSQSTSNAASISQRAAVAALTGPQHVVETMRHTFQRRRDLFVQGLQGIPGLGCRTPGGAFYLFVNVSRLGLAPSAIAKQWLEELYVATVPGEAFGSDAHIRCSFTTSEAAIQEGLQRIGQWVRASGRVAEWSPHLTYPPKADYR